MGSGRRRRLRGPSPPSGRRGAQVRVPPSLCSRPLPSLLERTGTPSDPRGWRGHRLGGASYPLLHLIREGSERSKYSCNGKLPSHPHLDREEKSGRGAETPEGRSSAETVGGRSWESEKFGREALGIKREVRCGGGGGDESDRERRRAGAGRVYIAGAAVKGRLRAPASRVARPSPGYGSACTDLRGALEAARLGRA